MPWPMRSVAKVITPWQRQSKSNVKLEAQKLVCFLETSIQFSTHFLYSGFILSYFNILSSAPRFKTMSEISEREILLIYLYNFVDEECYL